MQDESLILTPLKSLASGDADLDAASGPILPFSCYLHITDAVRIGRAMDQGLNVRLDPLTEFVPTSGACIIRFQVCPVPTFLDVATLATAIATYAIVPIATLETSTTGFTSSFTIPLPRIPISGDFLQLLVWVFPSTGTDGIDAGRFAARITHCDDNAENPFPNGI